MLYVDFFVLFLFFPCCAKPPLNDPQAEKLKKGYAPVKGKAKSKAKASEPADDELPRKKAKPAPKEAAVTTGDLFIFHPKGDGDLQRGKGAPFFSPVFTLIVRFF